MRHAVCAYCVSLSGVPAWLACARREKTAAKVKKRTNTADPPVRGRPRGTCTDRVTKLFSRFRMGESPCEDGRLSDCNAFKPWQISTLLRPHEGVAFPHFRVGCAEGFAAILRL